MNVLFNSLGILLFILGGSKHTSEMPSEGSWFMCEDLGTKVELLMLGQ